MSPNIPNSLSLRLKHSRFGTSLSRRPMVPGTGGSDLGNGGHTAVAVATPDMPDHDPRMITVEEVAQMVGLSVRQIWRLVSAGEFPQPIKLGRATRWNRQKLIDWINAGCPELND